MSKIFFLKFSEFCVKKFFLNFSVFLYDFTQNTENFKKNFLDIDIFYNCCYFFVGCRPVESYEPMHKLMLRFLKNITAFLFFSDRTHIHFFIKNHENTWKSYLGKKKSYLGKTDRKFEIFKSKKKYIYNKIIFETYDAIWTVWTLAFDCTTIYDKILTFEKNRDFLKKVLKKTTVIEKKTTVIGFWRFS